MVSEIMSGLMDRTDDCVASGYPVGIIPSGTANAMVRTKPQLLCKASATESSCGPIPPFPGKLMFCFSCPLWPALRVPVGA